MTMVVISALTFQGCSRNLADVRTANGTRVSRRHPIHARPLANTQFAVGMYSGNNGMQNTCSAWVCGLMALGATPLLPGWDWHSVPLFKTLQARLSVTLTVWRDLALCQGFGPFALQERLLPKIGLHKSNLAQLCLISLFLWPERADVSNPHTWHGNSCKNLRHPGQDEYIYSNYVLKYIFFTTLVLVYLVVSLLVIRKVPFLCTVFCQVNWAFVPFAQSSTIQRWQKQSFFKARWEVRGSQHLTGGCMAKLQTNYECPSGLHSTTVRYGTNVLKRWPREIEERTFRSSGW